MRTKKRKLSSQLPPTPVTPEMREQVIKYATSRGVSVAEIQREALAIFLRRNVSKANNIEGVALQTQTIDPALP